MNWENQKYDIINHLEKMANDIITRHCALLCFGNCKVSPPSCLIARVFHDLFDSAITILICYYNNIALKYNTTNNYLSHYKTYNE